MELSARLNRKEGYPKARQQSPGHPPPPIAARRAILFFMHVCVCVCACVSYQELIATQSHLALDKGEASE
jgi:hypothetical protein